MVAASYQPGGSSRGAFRGKCERAAAGTRVTQAKSKSESKQFVVNAVEQEP